MNLIIKIAWRNILRHKGKSVIIGVILFLGALIMTVGNGVISGWTLGCAKISSIVLPETRSSFPTNSNRTMCSSK